MMTGSGYRILCSDPHQITSTRAGVLNQSNGNEMVPHCRLRKPEDEDSNKFRVASCVTDVGTTKGAITLPIDGPGNVEYPGELL